MALSRFVRRPRRELSRPSVVSISAPQLRFETLEDRITPVFTPDPLFISDVLPATGASTNLNGAPLNIVVGDFNGDGRQDFAGAAATAAKSAPRIDVYLSDAGTGNTYTPLAIFPGTRTFGNPVGLAAVDVTSDGKAEIVAVSTGTGDYTVYRLENTGVFVQLANDLVDPDRSKMPFAPNLALGGVTGGDFNGDNKGDFVVTLTGSPNNQQYVVLLNNGNGKSFTEVTSIKTGVASTNFTEPISADFDVDGNLDFAMMNRSQGIVTVMFGNGAGGFTFARNLNLTSAPNSITAGDFDKNGKVDIAVGLQSGSVTLFLKDNAAGTTFTTKLNAAKFANPIVGLAAADYNIDGFADLAVVTSDGNIPAPSGQQNVEVVLGSANVLTTAMTTALGSPYGPLVGVGGSIAAVDLDANGNLDFVTGEGSSSGQIYTPYFNQSGVGGETFLFQDRTIAEFGEVINYDVTIFPPPEGGPLPTGDVQFFDVMTDTSGNQTFVFLGTDDLEAGLDNQGSSISVAAFSTKLLPAPLTVGPHTIIAKYLGDANYPTKNSNTTAINITKADTTATVTPSVANPVFGQPVTLFVSVTTMTGLIPDGQVDFFDNGNAIGSRTLDASGKAMLVVPDFTIGNHAIQARYAGSTNFAIDSSVGILVPVAKANSITALSANALSGIFGDTFTFTADVDIAAPGTGVASGSVEFYDGTTKVAVAAVNVATGVAIAMIPGLTVGLHDITAKFVETASVATSTSNIVTVSIAPTTSVSSLSANPTTNEVGTNVVLTATVNDTMSPPRPVLVGTVTFTGTDANGATITVGPVGVTNGVAVATIPNLPQGTSTFSATFSGTASIAGSTTNSVQVFTDRATPAAVLFNTTGTTTSVLGKDVTFTIEYFPVNGLTTPVTGTVNFTDNGSNVLATNVPIVNGRASVTTRLTLGAHAIAAAYSGNGQYKPLTTVDGFTVTRLIDPIAVGAGVGGSDIVRVYNPNGTIQQDPLFAFGPDHTSGARVATGDVNGDGVPDRIIGTGPGTQARVRVLDGVTSAPLFETFPFPDFTGGVFVSAADVNGDLRTDFVVTPDEGGGPRVTVFDGSNFKVMADFFGIDDPDFRGGARGALGDVNGDNVADLVVSAGFGGGPRVATFDGRSVRLGLPVKLFDDFFAFEQTLRNGAFPAVGDINGDGFGDLVMGAGPGGGPRVTAFSGADLLRTNGPVLVRVADFFAGDVNQRGGVPVATRTLDSDNRADIVTGSGPGGRRVNAYLGATIPVSGQPPVAQSFDAFGPDFDITGGVFVG